MLNLFNLKKKKMKIIKLYRGFTLACLLFFCFCNLTIAQKKGVTIKSKIVDNQGQGIRGVQIFSSNGDRVTSADDGVFELNVPDDASIVIEMKGFESRIVSISDLTSDITLVKSNFLASEDDIINMGVAIKNRRNFTGAAAVINTKERAIYDNTQFVRNYINGLMLGVKGTDNVRGLGDAIFVIDGVIGRNPNILNMEEVDQITILKDANAVALYGSQGRNGVIVINTKRGKINRNEVNVNIRTGIRTPISTPNYLDSAPYMLLYNEALFRDGAADDDGRRFSNETILNTSDGLNPFKYPDVNFYDEFIEPLRTTTNVITEFSGGNEKNQYYVNLGWSGNSQWVNVNDEVNARSDRFNIRGNINFKINDWITSTLDGIAIVSNDRNSRGDLLNAAANIKPFEFAPFLPVNLVDTTDPTVAGIVESARLFNGSLLGTSLQQGGRFLADNSALSSNRAPVALALAGGYVNTVYRSTQFNNSVNFDLDKILKGLSARTYVSFDFYDSYNVAIQNQFKTYVPTWEGDQIVNFGINNEDPLNAFTDESNVFGQNLKSQQESVSTNGFLSRFGFYGLVNYETTIKENHSLSATALAYYNSQNREGVIQTDIDSHLGFQMSYDYKKKLFLDVSGSYIHSIKLPEGNRGGLSPTVGLAYILSEESFLKENSFIDYLKIKASGGIIKSDLGITALNSNGSINSSASPYYLYDENYNAQGRFTWADGDASQNSNLRQVLSQGANSNLGFEERVDLNLGFEAYLMNSLWIEANYFRTELDKQLTFLQDQYPSYYNSFRPYDNFNNNLFTGFELAANFNKEYKDLSIGVGANILYTQTERLAISETNEFAYQNRKGRELSSILGLQDEGFYSVDDFSSDADGNLVLNSNLPKPNFGNVQPGDLKYTDTNNDGVVDNDDRVFIGQSSSPWAYGINVNLKYKAFNLFVLGTGQFGGDASKLSSAFNGYYTPGGNNKFSEVALERWTPDTADTATLPRLSAQNNQNNFRASTFWLYDNSFFNINRAQLTYEFKDTLCNKLGMEDFSVNISGTNLFELSKNRDIRQLRVGRSPLERAFIFGVRASF